MRVGQNPIKSMDKIQAPSEITVVVISYIPFLAGYYEESLEILKLCLDSIRAERKDDFDLLVFDNGSCEEVRNYLCAEYDDGRIQFLMQSERNIGKAGAWNMAFAAAPGETIVYADSDVLFHPGWLQAQLTILDTFPNIGMVTGMPILTPKKYSSATEAWAERETNAKVEVGALISWEDFWRHARSLGDDEESAGKFYEANPAMLISYKGQKAFMGAAHFQFAARKKILQEVLPIPAERPMGRVRFLDEAINEKGYLRLSTQAWFVEHMGNTLAGEEGHSNKASHSRSSLWQWTPIKKLLHWLYNQIFRILYRE